MQRNGNVENLLRKTFPQNLLAKIIMNLDFDLNLNIYRAELFAHIITYKL